MRAAPNSIYLSESLYTHLARRLTLPDKHTRRRGSGVAGAGEGMLRAWERYLATPTGRRDPEAVVIRAELAAKASPAGATDAPRH